MHGEYIGNRCHRDSYEACTLMTRHQSYKKDWKIIAEIEAKKSDLSQAYTWAWEVLAISSKEKSFQ